MHCGHGRFHMVRRVMVTRCGSAGCEMCVLQDVGKCRSWQLCQVLHLHLPVYRVELVEVVGVFFPCCLLTGISRL